MIGRSGSAWWCGMGAALLAAVASDAAEPWPGFRGRGDGHADGRNAPWRWESGGRGPRDWSIRLTGYGQSSPIVWGETVYVTSVSGDEKERLHLVAVSTADGATKWKRDFDATQRVRDSDAVSRAAPTPVADAERVYAVFESGDAFALSHAGEELWRRSFVKDYGEIKGPHGYASSPLLIDDRLVLQVAHAGPSYVLALDAKTGETLWKVDHPSQTGWSSPVARRVGDRVEIVVSTAGSVRALDASNGATLWVVDGLAGNTTASPTIAGDLVVIGASGERSGRRRPEASPPADASATPAADGASAAKPAEPASAARGTLAIRLDASDDSPESRIAWSSREITTSYASPVAIGNEVYFVNKVGVATCVDRATGRIHWQRRLPGEVWASPVAHDGRVTFFGKSGFVASLPAGPEASEPAESQVSTTDVVYGVAAIENAWIVRTGRGLQRISTASDDANAAR